MSSEIHRLEELDRVILRLLMDGWQTTEYAKSHGFLSPEQIAAQVALPVEGVAERLILMETLGYIINEQNYGSDPTVTYKRIDHDRDAAPFPEPRYHISDTGKRMVVAEWASEQPAPEAQS
jgi:hypothetical protein